MTAGPTRTDSQRKWRAIAAAAILVAVFAVGLLWPLYESATTAGPTVDEKLIALRTERAALQARADGVARVELLHALRVAGQLSDMLLEQIRTAFHEDVAVFEAQQVSLDRIPNPPQLDINADTGVIQARRILARMHAEEMAAQAQERPQAAE